MASQDWAAILFLLGAACCPLAAALYWLTRPPFRPAQWLLYCVNEFLVRFLWRAQLPPRLPLPPDQGAVLICNHRSSIDPCFLQAAAGRRLVRPLAAQLYRSHSLVAWVLRMAGSVPVRGAGSDASPTRAAIRLAREGALVCVLPEGTINTTNQFMLPVRPGAVLVALKARVPVVPCYIAGSPYNPVLWRPIFMPARVRMEVGPPIDLSPYYGQQRDKELVAELTLRCVRQIARLAGRDDFQPQIAGRDWKTWRERAAEEEKG